MVSVTREVALYHQGTFYHVHLKNRDGTPVRCRANGACKTWKTRPSDFRLPVKHGLRECFYITELNAVDWEITEEDYDKVRRRALRALLCDLCGVTDHRIPDCALYDLAVDRGVRHEALVTYLDLER